MGRRGHYLGSSERGSQSTGNPGLHRRALSPSAWSGSRHNDTPVDEDCSHGLQSHTCDRAGGDDSVETLSQHLESLSFDALGNLKG